MKYSFIYEAERSYSYPAHRVQVETEGCSLEDLLGAFESFLKGCGYPVDGTIEIVPDEDYDTEPNCCDGNGCPDCDYLEEEDEDEE